MSIERQIAEYRRRAREARDRAERAQSEAMKKGFADLAKEWDVMAERLLQDSELKK
jgi:hypothetical protein